MGAWLKILAFSGRPIRFNAWTGCTKISPGCKNCYAESIADRFKPGSWGPGGVRVVASESYWQKPLAWDRKAAKEGTRPRVFCASMADVFEDRPELEAPRVRLFRLIEATEHLDWLLLTKRPENVLPFYDRLLAADPFVVHDPEAGPRHQRWTTWKEIGASPARMWPNVWLGVSVEDQARADERIPLLLQTPAAVRFLSCEPLLGPVDLTRIPLPACYELNALNGQHRGNVTRDIIPGPAVDWVIVGGESGGGARPMNLEWARSLVTQCKAASVPVFVKQLGSCPTWTYYSGKPLVGVEQPYSFRGESRCVGREKNITRAGLRDPKGGDPSEWPEDLRVRQFPLAAPPAAG